MPCTEMTRDKGNSVPYIDSMPQPPGFRIYGYFLQDTTGTGLFVTVGKNPTDIYMPFKQLRGVIIFVSSPEE